ncbi:GNAT family N-acetyltransferase [Altererythrobacter lauratis]|uniref:GNAT family N-acetyltransferase n=1 Tax=Alteraurantiacibacter lauratis TaxID=2054627 RepID=A0ABV7EAM2_9SPHN
MSDENSFDPARISREEEDGTGAYVYPVEGAARPAVLTWRGAADDVRVVDHTFTPPEARGRGIAAGLVEAIVADARAEGFRIAPLCPYVVRAFGKNPAWADVRADLPR